MVFPCHSQFFYTSLFRFLFAFCSTSFYISHLLITRFYNYQCKHLFYIENYFSKNILELPNVQWVSTLLSFLKYFCIAVCSPFEHAGNIFWTNFNNVAWPPFGQTAKDFLLFQNYFINLALSPFDNARNLFYLLCD